MIIFFQDKGSASRLSKASFFRRWQRLLRESASLSTVTGVEKPDEVEGDLKQYSVAKSAARDFQEAKKQLFAAFRKANLGSWVKKPMEQDEFFLDE